MIRKAFRMSVHAGRAAEYAHRHQPIWGDLEAVLREHGVRTYPSFSTRPPTISSRYVEVESEAHWQAIAVTPVCRRWWASMRELMPANADGSPVSRPLAEVFHLERADVPSS